MAASWPVEVQLLLLRGVVVAVLYLFLLLALLVIAGDLRRAARPARRGAPAALGHLVLVEPGPTGLEAGMRFALGTVSSIGRALHNAVSLDDEFVSSEHALLTWRQGRWWIEDLGSTNGTFVNGMQISQPTPIGPGDQIGIGRVVLRLEG